MFNPPAARPDSSLPAPRTPANRREVLAGLLPFPLAAGFAFLLVVGTLLVAVTGAGAADPGPAATGVPAAPGTGPAGSVTPAPAGGEAAAVRRKPVKLAAHTRRVRFHGRVKVRGSSGLPFSSRVRLQFRPFGRKRWSLRTTARTTRSGRFTKSFRAHRSGLVRVIDRQGRSSGFRRVTVRSRIRLARTARTVKLGERLKITGRVLPKGSRRVRVSVYGAGRSVTVRSRSDGRFMYRWRPARAGDVRIRALAVGDRKAARSRSNGRRSSALRPGGASYYGPGLYGNGVACGGVLRPGTVGVAHKTLPCGTRVKFRYGHRLVTARVIDRGPFIAGRDWDLTAALRNKLGFGGVGTVWTNR